MLRPRQQLAALDAVLAPRIDPHALVSGGAADTAEPPLLTQLIWAIHEADAHLAAGDAEAARQKALGAIPLGRYGEPAEFGRSAAFLLSPAASFVSGAMLPVDGGVQA